MNSPGSSEPGAKRWLTVWVREYYDLIRILVISDLRVKYQSSVLGFLWSLLNPLLWLLVLYVIFRNMRNVTDTSLILYLFVGIIVWRVFQNGTSSTVRSIYGKPGLVKKIYIPRQILIFSVVISDFISSLLEFVILFAFLIIFSAPLSLNLLMFPPLMVIYFGIVYGVGLALGALFIRYRDLENIWTVLMQIGYFLTPIFYQVTDLPEQYQALYLANPVSSMMVMFREIMLYATFPTLSLLGYTILASGIIFAIGSMIFTRMEPRFAEEM
jgi:lipopolysaccharide transport system permease protein